MGIFENVQMCNKIQESERRGKKNEYTADICSVWTWKIWNSSG